MKYLFPVFAVSVLILAKYDDLSLNAIWLFRWALLCFIASVGFALWVGKKSWLLAPAAFYFLAIATLNATGHNWIEMDSPGDRIGLRINSILTWAEIAMCAVLFMIDLRRWLLPLTWASLACGAMIYVAPEPTLFIPIFHNPSMTGTFIGICLPLLTNPLLMLFGLIAIALTHSSTALTVAVAGLGYKYLIRGTRIDRTRMAAALLILALGYSLTHGVHSFLNGNGRFEIWHTVFSWLWHQGWERIAFGIGTGSNAIVVPALQVRYLAADPHAKVFYTYLHSDWLQIAFEYGLVGLSCALLAFCGVVNKAWHNRDLCAAVLAYGAAMATNFPLRWPLHMLLGLVLVHTVLCKPDKSS